MIGQPGHSFLAGGKLPADINNLSVVAEKYWPEGEVPRSLGDAFRLSQTEEQWLFTAKACVMVADFLQWTGETDGSRYIRRQVMRALEHKQPE